MKKKTLNLLILEDNPDDAELAVKELEREGFTVEWGRVDTEKAFREAIEKKPDLILADYRVPSFGGMAALQIQQQIAPDIPLIIISGTVGEETAVESMKAGAADYVMKDHIVRLGPAVKSALERKQVEEALWEERDKAQNYLDIAGVIIVAINSEGKVTLINKKGCEVLGYKEEEIIGRDWVDNFFPERIRDEVKEVSRKLLAGDIEPVKYFENAILTKSGQERIIAWHNTALKDEAGNIIAHLSSGNDITERKLAENALRKSEESYRYLVENANDIIYKIDSNGHFIYFNPIAVKITGYSEQDLLDKHYLELFHPDYREDGDKFYGLQYVKKIHNTYYEFPIVTKDGRVVWLGQNVRLIIEGDRIEGFHAVARDITERKHAEEKLKESEERYRTLFEGSRDAVYITTQDGKYIDFNQSMLDLFGYTREEMMAAEVMQAYVHPVDRNGFKKELEKKGFVRDYELKLRKKDGAKMDCLITATVRRASDGSILEYQGFIRDITMKKKLETQLQQAQKM